MFVESVVQAASMGMAAADKMSVLSPVPAGFIFQKKGEKKVSVEGRQIITTDSILVAKNLAEAGVGVAGIPSSFIENKIKSGTLVQLLPNWQGQSLGIYAVWAKNTGLNPVHRKFMDYLTQ